MVPGERIELSRSQGARDFKSLASTNSATQAHQTNTVEFIVFLKKHVNTIVTDTTVVIRNVDLLGRCQRHTMIRKTEIISLDVPSSGVIHTP